MFVSVRWTHVMSIGDGSGLPADHQKVCLRGKEAALFNPGEAFIQREEFRDFPPPTGVPEVGQVELILPGVLKPREP